ncbi:MFS transporter [Amorphus sp. 3PC139-8]|uniref:MFS transporter n=1 Tax=Amorphus sp. 3PC139-8 TaxID=2735676 RepID=UPI00345D445B
MSDAGTIIFDGWRGPLILALPPYLAFGCSLGLLQVAIPSILQRQGLPVESVSLVALLLLPLCLSVFWAPAVDRFALTRWGRRKSWFALAQTMVVASLLVLAFSGPDRLSVLLAAMLCLSVGAATMDVILDGTLAETAAGKTQAIRGGIKVTGMLTGTVLGSLVMIHLIEAAGWVSGFAVAALFSALAALPLVFARIDGEAAEARRVPSVLSFIRRSGNGLRLVLVVVVGLALGIGLSAPRLVMIEQGYALTAIGWIFGTAAPLAGALGAVGGLVLGDRIGLPRAFGASVLLFVLSASSLAWHFAGGGGAALFPAAAIALASFAYAGIYCVVCSLAMGWVATNQSATDYAMVQNGWLLAIVAGSALSGTVLAQTGLLVLPASATVVAAAAVALVLVDASSAARIARSGV